MFSFSRTGTGGLDISNSIDFEKYPCSIMYIPVLFHRKFLLQAPFLVATQASHHNLASIGLPLVLSHCNNMGGVLLVNPVQIVSVVVLISDKGCRNTTFSQGDVQLYTSGEIFKLNSFKLSTQVCV